MAGYHRVAGTVTNGRPLCSVWRAIVRSTACMFAGKSIRPLPEEARTNTPAITASRKLRRSFARAITSARTSLACTWLMRAR